MKARAQPILRLLIAAWALATAAVSLWAAGLSDSELRDAFSAGNRFFRQANEIASQNPVAAEDLYRRAALRFERIVNEGGIHNGKLYYNIGNAYYRMDDIGRAILNYRRAERLIPNDLNLQHNLKTARNSRIDSFVETQQARVLRTLLFWHYDVSLRSRSILFAFFSLIFWVAASIKLYRRSWSPRWLLVVSGVSAALFLGSLSVEAFEKAGKRDGVVLAQQVVARKGDGDSYEPSFKEPLHAGTEVVVVEQRGDWRHIELPDGRRCWVPSQSVEFVRP